MIITSFQHHAHVPPNISCFLHVRPPHLRFASDICIRLHLAHMPSSSFRSHHPPFYPSRVCLICKNPQSPALRIGLQIFRKQLSRLPLWLCCAYMHFCFRRSRVEWIDFDRPWSNIIPPHICPTCLYRSRPWSSQRTLSCVRKT